MLASREIAGSLRPGMHACTFGGNPIAAAAGLAMIETIEQDKLLEDADQRIERFADHLQQIQMDFSHVSQVRQAGFMIGIELTMEGAPIVAKCLERGLLINCTQGNVLRLLPAMNISLHQIDKAMTLLTEAIDEVTKQTAAVEA
jgi:acetylornithine/N-succinyldiaminopimelate aminotransferase